MGFLKRNHLKYGIAAITVLIIVSACTQPIFFRNMAIGMPGHFMFGKIPERNFYENVSIGDFLEPKWSAVTSGSQSNTSIVIYNDILFVSDLSGKLYAFDRKTGKQFGYEKFSGAIPVAPVVNNLRLFLMVNELNEKYSTIKNFDILNGKVLDESKIYGGVHNELLKLDDGIIVLSDYGELIKYNLVGTKGWSTNTKVDSHSSPASDGNVIVFGNEKGELISCSAKTGEVLYRKKICGGIEAGLSISGSNIYFGDKTGKVFCVNLNDGKIIWQYDTKNKIVVTPVMNAENLFIGNLNGDIFCLNKADGKLKWKIRTEGVIDATPLLLKNKLVQPDLNRKVYLIDVATGNIEKMMPFETRTKLSPVYYDGMIYLGADRGEINAYQTFKQ